MSSEFFFFYLPCSFRSWVIMGPHNFVSFVNQSKVCPLTIPAPPSSTHLHKALLGRLLDVFYFVSLHNLILIHFVLLNCHCLFYRKYLFNMSLHVKLEFMFVGEHRLWYNEIKIVEHNKWFYSNSSLFWRRTFRGILSYKTE